MTIKEWAIANPKLSISLIAFVITFVITLVTKKVTNQERLKELRAIQKKCQVKLREAKGDLKKQQEITKESWDCSAEMMKHSMKPMLYTFIPIIIIFPSIRSFYLEILPHWFWWYFGAAIVSSIILRKVLDVA